MTVGEHAPERHEPNANSKCDGGNRSRPCVDSILVETNGTEIRRSKQYEMRDDGDFKKVGESKKEGEELPGLGSWVVRSFGSWVVG